MDLKYIILFLTMIVFGAEAMMGAGSLVHFDFFNFWLAAVFIILGLWISDSFFYLAGRKFGEKFSRRFGRFIFLPPERFDRVKDVFARHSAWVIFISKLIYCAGHLTSAMAGASGMKFRRFFLHQSYSTTFSVLLFMSLGYFFSSFVDLITKDLKVISLLIVGFLALFFLGERLLTRIFRKKF